MLRIDIDALRTAYRGLRWIGRGLVLFGVLNVLALPVLLHGCTPEPMAMALVGRALVGVAMVIAGLRLGRAHQDGLLVATGLCVVLSIMAMFGPGVSELLSVPSILLVVAAYHPRLAPALEHRAMSKRER